MTVAELIKKLKKMPKDAKVFNRDHDHSEFETNGPTRFVGLVDKEDAIEDLQGDSHYENKLLEDMPDIWVTLSV